MAKTLDQIGLKYLPDLTCKRGKEYIGGDKTSIGHGFTETYERLFQNVRDKNINMLELGVYQGRSIAMWSDYFKNGKIYGIDINLCQYKKAKEELDKLGAFKNKNVQLDEYDVKTDEFKKYIETLPMLDIVIDDALHLSTTQFKNFILISEKMAPGGVYVVEDIEKPMGFIKEFGEILGGVSNKNSGFSKNSKFTSLINEIDSIEIKSNLAIFKFK